MIRRRSMEDQLTESDRKTGKAGNRIAREEFRAWLLFFRGRGFFGQVGREMDQVYFFDRTDVGRVFHDVSDFPHVARKGVGPQKFVGRPGKPAYLFVEPGAKVFEEMVQQ